MTTTAHNICGTQATVIDSHLYESIRRTVTYNLRKNAGSWISSEEIEDVVQNTAMHVFIKACLYDSSMGASFRTWAMTVAHNYSIQLARKMKTADDKVISLDRTFGVRENPARDDESAHHIRHHDGIRNSSGAWIMDTLGIIPEECYADCRLRKAEENSASERRAENLVTFLESGLNQNESGMLAMMRERLTKEEMMQRTHKTGCNIDTTKSRLRAKVRKWMKETDYYGE